MWYAHDVGWGWWLVMSVGMVAFWALVIYTLLSLLPRSSAAASRQRPDEPLMVLKRRLAAGELSIEQYQQLREALADDTRRRVAHDGGSVGAVSAETHSHRKARR